MNDIQDNTESLDFMTDEVQIVPEEAREIVKQINGYFHQITEFAEDAKNLSIENEVSKNEALDLSADVKTIYTRIETYRKKAIEPHRKIINQVNESAKNLQEALKNIEGTIKVKLAGYRLVQEIQAEKAKDAVKELSESLGLDIAILAPDAPRNLSSSKATTSTREKVSFEIVDANLIPDEYWMIDEKAIQKHIELGKKDIPGIKITTEKQMIIRRK